MAVIKPEQTVKLRIGVNLCGQRNRIEAVMGAGSPFQTKSWQAVHPQALPVLLCPIRWCNADVSRSLALVPASNLQKAQVPVIVRQAKVC